MSPQYETLIRQFAEGALTPEDQVTFDRLFESDPLFAEKATDALGERLGPAPDAFLDQVTAAARPGLEEAWKIAGPKATVPLVGQGLLSFWPVAALGGAFLAVLGTGTYLAVHREPAPQMQVQPVPMGQSALPPLQNDDEEAGPTSQHPSKVHPTFTQVTRKAEFGTMIRIQDLPEDPSVTVDILATNGLALRRLYQGPWHKDQSLDWDGRDSSGNPVAPGSYRAKVTTSTKTYVSEFMVQ